ncbi:MAG: TlpA disulfide reductase family protein [Hydrogenophaga sp.]|jgi:thiol-disulfide isomerase/thioredoxin|uniref:TlpA family protein disulfide reductase n=1 Tax=Hydrogenophaga sp. TaxID=1904254 RepID=UPI0025B8B58F|nr:TlpA disulfide reductase family protein [Hydrogenophaga sp.]MDO8887207.1 TlpA disulfide reductase family protein [Hydrogenophaga sp.]MDO9134651.1 TlpA disulfide reductase family protein [Hydrogenophaga sp.]MDO9604567.1 TlpA disulfide reductase family protein [Hydrogenophaga sp.]MDP2987373.1 TlpA disulfide reductase family protein [Hydrogenophaga sp.]MDP3205864.1 TlpA disulfide reductase family protein [Hydrogenophaga sp.]
MKLQRRHVLMTGAAVAAAGAGAWLSWRRIAPRPVLSGAEAAFWAGTFDGPNGETVNLETMRGRPLLVNFWATWCPPCVEELPLLNAFNTAHAAQGWQVLGLAVDQPSAVRGFLQKLPLNFPVGMAGFAGTELSKSLGNPSGSLPYTVVFGTGGTVLHRKIGKVSEADLAQWAQLG